MSQPLRSSREEMALAEVGHTRVSPRVASALVVVFLLTLLAVPALQHVHDFRHRPAEEGTWVPQSWDIFRVLPSIREVAAVRDARGLLALVPPAEAIRDFEREIEERSWLRRRVLPPTQLLLTGVLGVGNEQAYVGRDGWLFYRPCVEYLTGPGFLEPKRQWGPAKQAWTSSRRRAGASDPPGGLRTARLKAAGDPITTILDLKEQLRSRGIALVVLPTPAKPMIHPEQLAGGPAARPLANPSYREFLETLQANGVLVLDVAGPLFERKAESGEAQFLKADSHWTPAAMEDTARRLGQLLRERVVLAEPGREEIRREVREVAAIGDIAAMLRLAHPERLFPAEPVTIHPVSAPGGGPWRPSRDAEVLLLGDSFSNIYSAAAMGWGENAGFAEQLGAELGLPVDRIVINAGGAASARQEIARERAEGSDRLAGKKAVVWQFAVRELSGADWRPIGLGPAGRRPEETGAPAGTSEVEATVAAHAGVPEPGSVPYKDCLSALHLTSIETLGGERVAGEAIAYVMTMRDHAWTEAARVKAGARIRLRLEPWAAGEARYGGLNRIEIADERTLEMDAYWGEVIR